MDEQNNSGYRNDGSFGDSGNDSWQNAPNGNNYGSNQGYSGNPNNQPYYDPNNYQYNNGWGGNPYQNYPNQWDVQPNQKNGYGFSVAALVISLVNLLVFRSLLTFIALPLCIVFTVVAFKKNGQGKAMAVISLVISFISALIFGLLIAVFVKAYPEFKYYAQNKDEIIQEYRETGKIPEYFKKYDSPEYDDFWKASGYGSFRAFFDDFIDGNYERWDSNPFYGDFDDDYDDKYGDDHDDDTDEEYDEGYDDDGEELVIL